jgi:hypothetical protein
MKSKVVFVLAAFFALSVFAFAQTGPAGKWTGEQAGRGGATTPITLELMVSGSTLTGTYTAGENKVDIKEGKVVDASTIQFKRTQMGRGGEVTITVNGKIDGDTLTLTNEAPAGGGGGGGGAPGGGGGGGGGGRGGGRGGGGPITLKRAK